MSASKSIPERLVKVYGEETGRRLAIEVQGLIEKYRARLPRAQSGWSERDAFLITYGDSILSSDASPLPTLHHFLKKHAGDVLSFVHLLPFYPYTSDDGFAVQDFRAIRPDLGTWEDVRKMGGDFRLVFDGVINHVSASSVYAEGYFSGDPQYRDFFISLDPKTDTSSVLRTRNLPLLHDYETSEGKKWLWTTFSRDQIDLNYANPRVLLEVLDVLLFYAEQGAAMIRLDAIPYMWKKLGTSCAHLPEVHELIKLMRDLYLACDTDVLLLTETNVPHHENIRYFGDRGDEAQMIYNFSLAPLILWSLVEGNASTLTAWAKGLEKIGDHATYLNITATHDGIGMRPTEGILSEPERQKLVQLAYDHGGDMTGKRNSDGSVSPYELNLSYFDAVNDPRANEPLSLQVDRFILSQSIPMSMIGMPGVYIHSLLGSRNDYEGVKKTGRARSINRAQLTLDDLERELSDSNSLRAQVLGRLKQLLQIRGRQSAFHPNALQEITDLGGELFIVKRYNPSTGQQIVALHNMTMRSISVPAGQLGLQGSGTDLLDSKKSVFSSGDIPLARYQVRWLA